ncbi:MAG: error-prone DNA polymerase [Pseudomonadota bacterium]|nr:error-prone DNA polymerase [Pseudomonadota bacterium]
MDSLPEYAELHCLSNFTFLRGASHPEELIICAVRLGYSALAVTDECSLAGAVRAHIEAKQHGFKLIIGSEFRLADGLHFVLLAPDRKSYGRLSHLITIARRNAIKGSYHLSRDQVEKDCPTGCLALWLPDNRVCESDASWLAGLFPAQTWIAAEFLYDRNHGIWLEKLRKVGHKLGLPLCAAGDVHMHTRSRRALQDTLTAIRLGKPLSELGLALYPNGERHLRSRQILARIYPPDLLAETIAIAKQCQFSLDELRYEYPRELVPDGHTSSSWLRHLTMQGAQARYPDGIPEKVKQTLNRELALVAELAYEPYFLTVHDIVAYARRLGILCQGRGSAANSVICYCLHITEVDPARMKVLFERFISRERNEPPDIDVDFEHERREEVIQYIYEKYSRDRAALAATVITYRPRSAVRDIGKALGLSLDAIDTLAKSIQWWDGQWLPSARLSELGLDPNSRVIKQLIALVNTLIGFPRHLSQHTGGFVISNGRLSELVPIENAAMPDRTVIQWGKDDLDALGLLKVDVLSLGILTAIRKGLQYMSDYTGKPMTMADIPVEDPAVYAMLQRADSVGVFQVESRAQMSMLPRLKPACYYDLVIQVAIVRPGPIQGDMVHPYLRRRALKEDITYPSAAVRGILSRTLGVPIFQEQVMSLAITIAGFSPGEADQLRRSMTAWRRAGQLERFEHKLLQGMRARGYSEAFAGQIIRQIRGFGEYGFPESHSASFALLVYVSAWLKCHYPAAFTCALLNSQPMGFYAPAQLVQDAQRHRVEVRPVDVRYSEYDCTLEQVPSNQPALRLGLRMVKGLPKAGGEAVVSAREKQVFKDVEDLAARACLNKKDIEALAASDALQGLASHRHRAWWKVAGLQEPLPLFETLRFKESEVLLRKPEEGEDIAADYAHIGLTLRRHPVALVRENLDALNVWRACDLQTARDGLVRVAGLITCRQRPGTASGVVFITLEDETGYINVIVWPQLAEKQRRALLGARLLMVIGTLQQESGVLHVVARRLEDLSAWIGDLVTYPRDFS